MSFPRYPEYKDSGVEWLGEVPKHWEVRPIKRVASISYGLGQPPAYHDDGTPLIRATNVDGGRIDPTGMVYVCPDDISAHKTFWLSPGNIIVVRSGAYTGDSAIIRTENCPAIAGFDMVLHSLACCPDFLQYSLLSPYLKKAQIDLESLRAAQPHLNAEELGSCSVLFPPEDEQSVIAAFLDRETGKIDALVAEQEKLIELLKEKRQAVISHAVTKGLDPNVPMKDSGVEWLGEVPAHWEVVPLRWFATCRSGSSLPPEHVERDRDEHAAIPVIGGNGIMGFTEKPNAEHAILAVGRVGALCGNVHSVTLPAWVTDNALVLDPSPAKFSPEYLAHALRARNLNDIASKTAQPLITGTQVLDQRIPCPALDEQLRIITFLEQQTIIFHSLCAEAQRSIDLLKERRSALISAAVTGKIDVRGLADSESALSAASMNSNNKDAAA